MFSIFFDYLEQVSVFNLIFGGIFFNFDFDFEYASWVGAAGLMGIIAFFILRQDDPKKAKNCLYLGINDENRKIRKFQKRTTFLTS